MSTIIDSYCYINCLAGIRCRTQSPLVNSPQHWKELQCKSFADYPSKVHRFQGGNTSLPDGDLADELPLVFGSERTMFCN